MRTSGGSSVKSPNTIASAVSTCPLPFEISRSNPRVWNNPHLVGICVETTRRIFPASAVPIMIRLSEGRVLYSREVRRTLLEECRKRFPCLPRTHPRGKLLVLDLHGLLD